MFFNKYPYTDFHELNLDWILCHVKKAVAGVETLTTDLAKLTDYVKNYFDNLDLSDEISDKIDALVESGEMEAIVADALSNRKADSIGSAKMTSLLYDDVTNSGNFQGLCALYGYHMLYLYEDYAFPVGRIHVYDTSTQVKTQIISNVTGYHGNDLELVNNKIYIAQCYKSAANVYDGNELLSFSLADQSMEVVHTFNTPSITGVASIDNDNLIIIGNSSIINRFSAFTLYKYTISTGTVSEITVDSSYCPTFTANQGTYFDRDNNIYYVLVSGPDMLLMFDYLPTENKLKYKSCCQLEKRDSNGINCGEFEGVTSLNGRDLYLGSQFQDTYGADYSVNIGLVNVINGYPTSLIPYNYHDALGTDGLCYCSRTTGGSQLENGSQAHPFKTLSRAIEALNFSGRFRVIRLQAGNYGSVEIRDRKVNIDLEGNVTFTKFYALFSTLNITGTSQYSFAVTDLCQIRHCTGEIDYWNLTTRLQVEFSHLIVRNLTINYNTSAPLYFQSSIVMVNVASITTTYAYKINVAGLACAIIPDSSIIADSEIQRAGYNWSIIRLGSIIS